MREMRVLCYGNLGTVFNLTEKPRPVKLLAIFYGLQGFLLLSIFMFFFASPLLYRDSGPPIGGAAIAILLIWSVSLGGALLYLSIAHGLLLGKSWARTLGIGISILALLYCAPAMILSIRNFLIVGLEYLLNNWMFLVAVGIPTVLNSASIHYLTRREVKAYFKHDVHTRKEEQKGVSVKLK